MTSRQCLVCGADLPPKRKKYCSKACGTKAFNERERLKRQEKKRKLRAMNLDEYGAWDAQRKREGLPHISYGQYQAERYKEKLKKDD